MTYTTETRHDTTKTKQLLETTEMRILGRISGNSLFDRNKSENISRACHVKNINGWITKRDQECNDHINRMSEDRLVRIARDNSDENG